MDANAAAVATAAAASATKNDNNNKNSPPLHSVTSSLRSCLDGMLPDDLRNDPKAFQAHVTQHKNNMQSEKNSWRFGLNYLFETLRQHKEWFARNQQFVQLTRDSKKLQTHVSTIRSTLSESVSKLELEAGLREAELEGRVGSYRVMFEVTKIVSKLSRPLVKLQILKPSDSSLSIYCDTFVLDIILTGGDGKVESATLMTVEKDQSKQYPDRDEDLLKALRLLADGKSALFIEKLDRLINRAELAVKHPTMNFEEIEDDIYSKLQVACQEQRCWSVRRGVEGILIHFQNALHCSPIADRPKKKQKTEDTSSSASSASAAVAASAALNQEVATQQQQQQKQQTQPQDHTKEHLKRHRNGVSDSEDEETAAASSASPTASSAAASASSSSSTLADGEWSASIGFIEWRNEVSLHFVADQTPLVMAGVQARRLALTMLKNGAAALPGAVDRQEEERLFNQFVSWRVSGPSGTAQSMTAATGGGPGGAPHTSGSSHHMHGHHHGHGHGSSNSSNRRVDAAKAKAILPKRKFSHNHSVCSVLPTSSNVAMVLDFSLTTKEISGGLQLHSFPMPLVNVSAASLTSVLKICGHSLFFHSVLLSAFCRAHGIFGKRLSGEMAQEAAQVAIHVDVAAPERITLKLIELTIPEMPRKRVTLLIELLTKMDCSIELKVKPLKEDAAQAQTDPTADVTITSDNNSTEDALPFEQVPVDYLKQLGDRCHSVPLVTYYLVKKLFASQFAPNAMVNGAGESGSAVESSSASAGGVAAGVNAGATGENCNGIAALADEEEEHDELAHSMKVEGESMLLDDMMF